MGSAKKTAQIRVFGGLEANYNQESIFDLCVAAIVGKACDISFSLSRQHQWVDRFRAVR